ncbi:MAG: hypothetical protein GY738_20390, partial [Pseudoalteromonas sp.]|nr:hypothetical protein [Pseudoalteromonas sp.]
KLIDRAAGLYIRPAIYTKGSARVLCIENWSHFDCVIPKNTRLGHLVDVEIAARQPPEINKQTIRIINYNTPEEKAEHWENVKPELSFGDTSPETAEAREKLMTLFEEDHDIFALKISELGLAKDIEFDFELTETPPKQYPRRLPQALKQKVYDKLLEDVEAGITRHSDGSEFAS